MGILEEAPSRWAIFCNALEKIALINFNAIWVTFLTFLEPFERTTFLRFESRLKSSNCLVLPLLTG